MSRQHRTLAFVLLLVRPSSALQSPLRLISQLLAPINRKRSGVPSDSSSLDVTRYCSQQWFHHIDVLFPGLRLIHEEPYIFAVDDFLSEDECAALIDKFGHAAGNAATQGMGDNSEGSTRTSMGVVAENEEIPALRDRIAKLARVELAQMQPTKLTRYERGQSFSVHSDVFAAIYDGNLNEVPYDSAIDVFADGNRQVNGYGPGASTPGINRHCTVLVYLNDCEDGGHTCWLWTKSVPDFYEAPRIVGERDFCDELKPADYVLVQPRRGTAVIHFPSTTLATGGISDPNARHEGAPAGCTKFIAQTFIWNVSPDAEGSFDFIDNENLPSGRLSASTL